jgi:hypothetical protein
MFNYPRSSITTLTAFCRVMSIGGVFVERIGRFSSLAVSGDYTFALAVPDAERLFSDAAAATSAINADLTRQSSAASATRTNHDRIASAGSGGPGFDVIAAAWTAAMDAAEVGLMVAVPLLVTSNACVFCTYSGGCQGRQWP